MARDEREVVATPSLDGTRAGERRAVPRLINRLRPAPLESLGSLLERLRVANHYQERGWLGGLLRRHPERPEVLRRVEDFQTLEALTGLGQADLIGLTLHRFAPWYGVAQRAPRPALPAVVPIALWPDIGGGENTREAAAVCPACWRERPVILVPWWLHHLTACPRHLILLRQRCAGCEAPLRLTAGQVGCGQCGAAIGAMATRSIARDADEVELSALLWRATGCVEGAYPPEGLTLVAGHPLRRLGTPALLAGVWGYAQMRVARDRGPQLQTVDSALVHEALAAAWQALRAWPTRGGAPFPLPLGQRGRVAVAVGEGSGRRRAARATERPV